MTRFEFLVLLFATVVLVFSLLMEDYAYHARQDEIRSQALQIIMMESER